MLRLLALAGAVMLVTVLVGSIAAATMAVFLVNN
jgi:hypothetical protein